MPKRKSRKGVVKRIKVSAKGVVMAHYAGRRHLLSSKSSKSKRRMRRVQIISGVQGRKLARLANLE